MTYTLYPAAEAFRTQSDPIGQQYGPVIASLADGGTIAAWTSQRDPDSSYGYDVILQRYDASGAAVGAMLTVYEGPDTQTAVSPVVTGLADGGWALSFRDVEATRVQSYNAAGLLVSETTIALPPHEIDASREAEVFVSGSGMGNSAITALEGGGFAVAFSAFYWGILAQYSGASTIYMMAFEADGTPAASGLQQISPWIAEVSYSYDRGNYMRGMAALGDGGYAVLTRIGYTTPGNDSDHAGIGVQFFNADGTARDGAQLVNQSLDAHMSEASVATLADGSIVVAWNGGGNTWWRHYAADGTALSDEMALGYNFQAPTVSATEDGGFLLTFRREDAYHTAYSIRALRFDADGEQVGDLMTPLASGDSDVIYYRTAPQFAVLGDGGMMGIWNGYSRPTGYAADVLAQLYRAERLGTEGDDALIGAARATVLYGGGGDDTLTGGAAGDMVFGDEGNDSLVGLGGADTLDGGVGDDTLRGGDGDDMLIVAAGTDVLYGGGGADTATLDTTQDAITIRGPADALELSWEGGSATLTGIETISFADGTTADPASLLALRDQELTGTDADDTLTGDHGNDLIQGLDGNDLLTGAQGADTLEAGTGSDTLLGGPGNDQLDLAAAGLLVVGGDAANGLAAPVPLGARFSLTPTDDIAEATTRPHMSVVASGSGETYEAFSFSAQAGETWIFDIDGASFDTVVELRDASGTVLAQNDDAGTGEGANGSTSGRDSYFEHLFDTGGTYTVAVRAYGGGVLDATDSFTLNLSVDTTNPARLLLAEPGLVRGGTGNDRIFGAGGGDVLFGDAGFDTILAGAGNDTVYGGNGRDVARLEAGNDIFHDNAQTGPLGADIVAGGDGNDTIRGGAGDDGFYGGYGNDVIQGGLGDDFILGDAGGDMLYGGDGNDRVTGGNGPDTTYLGRGNDIFYDNTQAGPLGADAVHGGDGSDTINGGGGNDSFYGDSGADWIDARYGDDLVVGGNGQDRVFLGAGNDRFIDTAQGGLYGRDTVDGGQGNDMIGGGGGDDRFDGGAGNDTILGRNGNDMVYGGDGFDEIETGAGDDHATGGRGRDWVRLGAGDDRFVDSDQTGVLGQDTIEGGAGADVFVFGALMSADEITDFETGIDTLELDATLASGRDAATLVAETAELVTDGLLLEFGDGNSLLLQDLTGADGLAGSIVLV